MYNVREITQDRLVYTNGYELDHMKESAAQFNNRAMNVYNIEWRYEVIKVSE